MSIKSVTNKRVNLSIKTVLTATTPTFKSWVILPVTNVSD